MSLGGVVDHRQIDQRVGRRPSVEMDDDHRRRSLRAVRSPRLGGDGRGPRLDVDEHRGRTERTDCGGGRHGGERGDQHLVAGSDTEPGEGELDRCRAGADPDRLVVPGEGRERSLERLQLGSQEYLTGAEHAVGGGLEGRQEIGQATTQLDDRYHGCCR